MLRWEQVPLQWSRGSGEKGGEEKRHQGGGRDEVSEIKCNRAEKTKAKFNHRFLQTGTRQKVRDLTRTDRENRRDQRLCRAQELGLNVNLKLRSNALWNINIKLKKHCSLLMQSLTVMARLFFKSCPPSPMLNKAVFLAYVKEIILCVITWMMTFIFRSSLIIAYVNYSHSGNNLHLAAIHQLSDSRGLMTLQSGRS